MNIKELSISQLHEYDNNPRNNDRAVDAVAESIREFGFKVPIVIDGDNVIVCGHTRVKAAQKLGMETVPCIIADDLTPEQIKAFRLADNKIQEMSGWDFGLLDQELDELRELGFGDEEMKELGFGDASDVNPDDFFEDDNNGDGADKEPKTIECTCPECGHKFTQEVK